MVAADGLVGYEISEQISTAGDAYNLGMSTQPGRLSRVVLAVIWLALGLAMVAVAGWVGWTRWTAVLNGHPALLVAGIGCALIGIVAIAWSIGTLILGDRQDREGDPDHPARRTPQQLRRRATARILTAIPTLLVCFVLAALVAYSRPYVATPEATAALRTEQDVRVVERIGWYELLPTRELANGETIKPTTALVFVPGAKVDSRAYAPLLRPLAKAGYLVAVLKEPFGLALPGSDHAQKVLDVHPEIQNWTVAGHSLGGVAASSFVDDHPQVKGLALWAAYPAAKLNRTDLKVTSISGDLDGLTTPADVAKSRADLPAGTQYVVVPGAIHSFFGDYGLQPGDGQATADRVTSQAAITKATQALVASTVPPPKKK